MEKLYYGRGKDEDNKELIAFLDDVFFFQETDGTNFLGLLPKIYKDKYRPAYNNFVVQDKNGNFRSAIGNFYNKMVVGGEELTACCIGNVAVGRDYRGMGYMKELMQMSVADMKQNGVSMAYLGGQRQRYGYFGFEISGVRYEFNVDRAVLKHAYSPDTPALEAIELTEDMTEEIEKCMALAEKHPVHSVRPADAFVDILKSWYTTPFILKDKGKFVGYIAISNEFERVSELEVVSPEYYEGAVLAAFAMSDKDKIDFPVGPYETEKIKFFTVYSEGMDVLGCESVLVLDFEKTIRAYLKAKSTYQKLCDGEATFLIHGKFGDEKIKIAVNDNFVNVESFSGDAEYELNHFEATRAFFSNLDSDRSSFTPEIQQWFPLPAYISSSDTM